MSNFTVIEPPWSPIHRGSPPTSWPSYIMPATVTEAARLYCVGSACLVCAGGLQFLTSQLGAFQALLNGQFPQIVPVALGWARPEFPRW